MLRSSSTKAIVGMSLLSVASVAETASIPVMRRINWASEAVTEQCKLG
jgi:hypothetical protein